MKVTVIPIVIGVLGSHQRIGTEIGRIGNKNTSGAYPNYCTVEISQNTEKSPGDLRRLAVTQIPMKNPSANAGVKNSQNRIWKNIIIIIITIIEYFIYIYKKVVKSATLVKDDPKAPFSIATTPRCWKGRYSISWIAPLYPWSVPYKDETDSISHSTNTLGKGMNPIILPPVMSK